MQNLASGDLLQLSSDSLRSHHANDSATLFRNPWKSAAPPNWFATLSGSPVSLPLAHHASNEPLPTLRVDKPTWGSASVQKNALRATFLGHASVLLQLANGRHVLFDPIFSFRAGPSAMGVSSGPSRLLEAPCSIQDLPGCDFVCISHK